MNNEEPESSSPEKGKSSRKLDIPNKKPNNIKISNSKPFQTTLINNSLDELLKGIRADTLKKAPIPLSAPPINRTTYDEEIQKERAKTQKINNDKLQIENERLKTENDNLKNDQELKSQTLLLLFVLLFVETTVIFVLAFFQGFKFKGFNLDTLTLRIVVVATLTQISAMLTFAVRHLFPTK